MTTEKIMLLADMFADACVSDTEAGYCAASAAELERLEAAIDTSRAALKAEVERLAAENKVLQMALRSATYLIDESTLTCHNLSHNSKTFHEWDEPCPVEKLAKERYAAVIAALTKEATNG